LRACLRRDPGQRPSAGEVRAVLRQVAEQLAASQWPIQKGGAA
jgi:hypothetical protein